MRVLVYGGRGSLGRQLIQCCAEKHWKTISIDFGTNSHANDNIVIDGNAPWTSQSVYVQQELEKLIKSEPLDAVVCVAGGWAGGNLNSDDIIEKTEAMWMASVQTAVLSARIAAKHLSNDGLLVLPGAAGAINPTPGMIGYGIAKAAIHHLVRSCAANGSGLPKDSCTLGIMPTTLDTEMNRKAMPKADFSNWTPLDELSMKIADWIQKKDIPKSGSLVKIETNAGKTSYEII